MSRLSDSLSFLAGGLLGLVLLYLAYAVGMLWQFETMVNAQQPPRVVTLAIGRVGGTDLEIEGCYFQIGDGAMLALNPRGEFCQLAREQIGTTGVLMFVPD